MTQRSRTIRANGLNFAIDEAGDGADVALCLHGFPESRASWRHQLPAIAALGWRAVAADLRGYGDSDRPIGIDAYRMEHLLADVAGMFDALNARRRILIAHDWGGIIAWQFAMRQIRPLDGLVILNAPHPAIMQRIMRSWRQRLRSWYIAFFKLPKLPELVLTAGHAKLVEVALRKSAAEPNPFPKGLLDQYRNNAARPGAMSAMLNYYRANFPAMLRQDLPTVPIETPTLVVWGERDTAMVPEFANGLDAHVKNLTLHRLPNVSHWVQEEASDIVNERITQWLQTLFDGNLPRKI